MDAFLIRGRLKPNRIVEPLKDSLNIYEGVYWFLEDTCRKMQGRLMLLRYTLDMAIQHVYDRQFRHSILKLLVCRACCLSSITFLIRIG